MLNAENGGTATVGMAWEGVNEKMEKGRCKFATKKRLEIDVIHDI